MVRFWQVWPAVLQDQVRHGSSGVGVEPIWQSRRLPAPFDLASCGHAQQCRTHRVRWTGLSDFHATIGDVEPLAVMSAAKILAEVRFEFGDAHGGHGSPFGKSEPVFSVNVNQSVHGRKRSAVDGGVTSPTWSAAATRRRDAAVNGRPLATVNRLVY